MMVLIRSTESDVAANGLDIPPFYSLVGKALRTTMEGSPLRAFLIEKLVKECFGEQRPYWFETCSNSPGFESEILTAKERYEKLRTVKEVKLVDSEGGGRARYKEFMVGPEKHTV